MTSCPTYVAPHHAQLGADGGKWGAFNCTASSAARVAQQSTCGKIALTGGQVRAATNEPKPDPQSPGLNLEQVDAALHNLAGIDLDVRRAYSAELAITRVLKGEPAIIQFQRDSLVKLGYGFGSNFRGGHAGSMDGIGGLHVDDPLTQRFAINEGEALVILGSLVINGHPIGLGNAYVAFGPDSIASHWVVSIQPQKGTKGYPARRWFNTFDLEDGRIIRTAVMRTGGFSATSTAPIKAKWAGHADQLLVQVIDGNKARGKFVRAAWAHRES